MSKPFRIALATLFALSFVSTALFAGQAAPDAAGTQGYVADSAPLGAQLTLATDSSTGAPNQIVPGRGASFPAALFTGVLPLYNAANTKGHDAGYGICGSSCGKRGFFGTPTSSDLSTVQQASRIAGQGPVDQRWSLFAGSDAPLSAADYAKVTQYQGEALHVPYTIGTVAMSYNLPGFGVGDVKLTPDLVSRIFRPADSDAIKVWNHPDLVAVNPRLAGVATPITPVVRCDGSGTTFVFTDWLARTTSHGWAAQEARIAGVPTCGPQNQGVRDAVAAKVGGIGYVELAFANTYAAVRNGENSAYVLPSPATGTAAAEGAAPNLPPAWGNWSQVSIVAAPGANAYPISSFTYVVVWANPYDVKHADGTLFRTVWTAEQYAASKHLLGAILTTYQAHMAGLKYSPLPANVQQLALDGLERMNYGPRLVKAIANPIDIGYPVVGQRVTVYESNGVVDAFTLQLAKYTPATGLDIAQGTFEGQYVKVAGTATCFASPVDNALVGAMDDATILRRSGALQAVEPVSCPAGATHALGQVVGGTLVVRGFA